ncbi:MAG: hypothetical protein LLG45_12520 [Actinomycetia bacterium]|nr:hypothetical protein [Actinomycetes bacterium]
MYFDRIDICEAYYLFLSLWHEGQSSLKYQRLCRLVAYFHPRPSLRLATLTPNGKALYSALVRKERQRTRATKNR